jgi:translation initiation factor IF-3
MFRGREVTHPERGTAILDRLAEELSELGVVEQRPMQEGRNMTMMMAPSKAVLAGRVGEDGTIDTDEHPDHAIGDVAQAAEPLVGDGAVDDSLVESSPEPVQASPEATQEPVESPPDPAPEAAPEPEPEPAGESEPETEQPAAEGGTATAGSPVS